MPVVACECFYITIRKVEVFLEAWSDKNIKIT
jgi:hypothetical protein